MAKEESYGTGTYFFRGSAKYRYRITRREPTKAWHLLCPPFLSPWGAGFVYRHQFDYPGAYILTTSGTAGAAVYGYRGSS